MSTAGVTVIGNEVLSGKVEEENARFLIPELRKLGVQVRRIAIIRDDVETIAREVREMSAALTHVFTAGGVGATHDDVTFEGVASAFDLPIERNQDLARILQQHYGERLNGSILRMADLPRGAVLVGLGTLPFPIVTLRNVYVLPGVPSFLRAKFEHLRPLLQTRPFVLRQIYARVGEDLLANAMTEVARAFPDLEIGSYPRFDHEEYRVKITIEAREVERVDAGVKELLLRFHPEWIVRTE